MQIGSRLREINLPLTYDFVVHRVLDSLQLEYELLKVCYTTLREKCSIDQLISIYVQEEDIPSKRRAEKAHLIATVQSKENSNNKKSRLHKRNNQGNSSSSSNSQNE